jgi:hypothetical protein
VIDGVLNIHGIQTSHAVGQPRLDGPQGIHRRFQPLTRGPMPDFDVRPLPLAHRPRSRRVARLGLLSSHEASKLQFQLVNEFAGIITPRHTGLETLGKGRETLAVFLRDRRRKVRHLVDLGIHEHHRNPQRIAVSDAPAGKRLGFVNKCTVTDADVRRHYVTSKKESLSPSLTGRSSTVPACIRIPSPVSEAVGLAPHDTIIAASRAVTRA